MRKFIAVSITGISVLTLLISNPLYSQSSRLPVSFNREKIKVEKVVTVDPKQITTDWDVKLQNIEMPVPGGQSQREQLMLKKEILMRKYPRTESASSSKQNRGGAPYVGRMFEGNQSGNGVPNDNDMAISDDGYLVSVINSNIYMYDVENDTLLFSASLGAFTLPLNITQQKYDPKVVYDPMEKRFVLVFLNGTSYQTSKVIVCFSSSSNPLDPWHQYKLNGNPLNNDTWSDYPVIGISATDLYIGINTFFNGSTNNSGFYESCFWQISLYDGYAGDSLRTAYYHDIAAPGDTLFNICPIHRGAENLNQDMFLLSNKNLAMESDTFYLLHITEPLMNGNPQLEVTLIHSDRHYFLPPPANQPSGNLFDTNDSRVFGGFESNGTIQFVQATMDTINGHPAIYHGFIDDIYGAPSITANVISHSMYDYGFPNIGWTGYYPGEGDAIITFNFASTNDYAGMGAVYFQPDSSYTPITILQTGNGIINVISGPDERWGDYSGIQRKYNEPCKIWAAGSYAKSGNKHGTWIAELSATPTCSSNPFASTEEVETNKEILVYPNPVQNYFNVEFELSSAQDIEIAVYDINGKLVAILLNDRAKSGKNNFGFSTEPLNGGVYFLQIRKANGELISVSRVVKA